MDRSSGSMAPSPKTASWTACCGRGADSSANAVSVSAESAIQPGERETRDGGDTGENGDDGIPAPILRANCPALDR
ncbi:hypothetical protein LUX33_25785 [Actinomadura madurae]|uniref:hypothetical protein n=1 Tax=Actinomadura madurae TaxID=1993 RepID=UPI0020D1FAC0|nr:hypothetical protein [Actinomadura madurae]MCP9951504.1 hypothetical protein [Actinomadura madurae]